MTAATSLPVSSGSPAAEPSRVRLEFLDGLRGLAALTVVFSHVYAEMMGNGKARQLPSLARHFLHPFMYGRYAVDVFIVLSGYCLMLPVARSASGQLRGGIADYLKRRARRILPPYYAALALTLLLIALTPGLQHPTGVFWDLCLPAFTPGVLLSHLFLVHNLNPDWIYKISSPMWSVATEWQIYFFFPVLLLPLWRRFGTAAAVGAAFAIGLGPHFLARYWIVCRYVDTAIPWFLGLFALGMAGAILGFSPQPTVLKWRKRISWGMPAALATSCLLALLITQPRWWSGSPYIRDIVIGIATTCLIIYCAEHAKAGDAARRPRLLRLLEARRVVALGGFSYSLYLVHQPLLSLFYIPLRAWQLPAAQTLLFLVGGAVPLCLLAAYLFHLAFERRFMSRAASAPPVKPLQGAAYARD